MAVAMETVTKDATELQSKQQEATVHKMSREKKTTIQWKQRPKKPCYRCKGTTHILRTNADLKKSVMTVLNGAIKASMFVKKHTKDRKKTHFADHSSDESDEDTFVSTLSATYNSVKNKKSLSNVIQITPDIDSKQLQMELDTGSAVSVISNHFVFIYLDLMCNHSFSTFTVAISQ